MANEAPALAEVIEQQRMIESIVRTIKESADDFSDDSWSTIAGYPAPATYTGGLGVRRSLFSRLRDREDGRFLPFYDTERDLDLMRSKMRALASFTSVAVGAMQALRVYCMGGEWEYEVTTQDGVEAPAGLVEECQTIVDAILERNAFIGDLDLEIHDAAREDGEAPIACYATHDGLIDIRRLDADNIREPADPRKLNDWLDVDARQVSWTFGVATLFDDRMGRIDHEQPAGYHVVFTDDGDQWDFMPNWPRNVGDPDLDGKFLHLIKRNTPRRAKRGISDYWSVMADLEREDKLNTNLTVGAAVLAAIAWIEEMPPNANREQVAGQLSEALTTLGRSLTTSRGSERQVQHMRPGSVIKVSNGRKYESGPLGQPRSQIWIEVSGAVKRRIASRWNMPEYMISADASNANFSSTLVAESPFVKGREAEQKQFVAHFRTILMKALKIACDRGRFRKFGVDWRDLARIIRINIQPPKVASRDKTEQLAELQALWEIGAIDANEFRIDLGRESKPELEGVTKPAGSPLDMLGGQQQGPPGAPGGPPSGLDQLAAQMRNAQRSGLQAAVEEGMRRVQTIEEAKALITAAIREAKAAVESDPTPDPPKPPGGGLRRPARRVSERVKREGSDCGANAPGGGGFQSGNKCAGDGGGGKLGASAETVTIQGTEIEVQTNPTKAKAKRLLSTKNKKGVRLLKDADGNIWAWDAMSATHDQMQRKLKIKSAKGTNFVAYEPAQIDEIWSYLESRGKWPSHLIVVEAGSACGANAPGGGGFQPGNTCSDEDGGGESIEGDFDGDGEPDNPVDDPERDPAEGQAELFDKNDGKGPPSIRELPIEKQWEETRPRIDELVEQAEGEEIEIENSWDSLGEDEQQEAQLAWENDNFAEYQSKALEDATVDLDADLDMQIREDEAFTDHVLQMKADDWGIDRDSISDAISGNNGEVEPSYLRFEGIDDDDPESDALKAARWEEIKAEYEEAYESEYEGEFEQRKETALQDIEENLSTEDILEAMSTDWHENVDEETKMQYAGVESTIKVETPEEFVPFDDSSDSENYQKTRAIVRYIQDTRAREILEERGIDPGKVDQLHSAVWSDWKGSSTSAYGKAIQLAASDELGSVGKPEYEQNRAAIISGIGGEQQFEALKGYVRATWESSQYALEKADQQEITVWRGLMLPGSAVESTEQVKIDGGPIPGNRQHAEYVKVPNLKILRNAAQSTTSDPSVANSWGGVGQRPENAKRVVLRIKADPRAVLSLPVHGQNLKHENEVILTGHGWTKWDAWLDRAPSVDIDSIEDKELHGETAA